MNFQGNFREIGQADLSAIQPLVEALTEAEWAEKDTRQKRYEVHKDTQFIGIAYDEDFRHMNPTRQPHYEVFKDALHPLFAQIADYYESAPDILAKFQNPPRGYLIRVSLTRLKAGGVIDEHRDMNFSLSHSHRVHVPIITHDDVHFKIGGQTFHIPEGEILEINNRRLHSVENNSDIDRVHLILDWVFPWEPCCCSGKVHPGEPCTPQNCLPTDRLQIPCTCHPETLEYA